jgi:serine/threonine protein kinase
VGETAKLHYDLEALVGATIHGRYEVETLLGVGGMGAVFKGRHTGLQRGVAIKVLHPEIGRDPSVSKRFDREAQSASRLDHPNCVRVTDFGTTENGTKYLVMELLEGGDLDGRLGQPWAPDLAVATIEQVLRGLEHAHHVGIVHRDLKPENIFVTRDFRGDEVVKIVDFGIAKLIDEQGSEKLTRQGIVFGTPRYMAPEQAAGGKIDERTDLYAVGLIFYELLAGHPPFQSDDAAQLLRMQIMAPPPPLPASVPASLGQIVGKLIEKSKNDRFTSAREVLEALANARASLAAVAAMQPVQVVVTAAVANPPSSSGVAWRPASESAPAISGVTVAAATVDLAAVSMSVYSSHPTLRTGSHAGVGQPATGPFPALDSGAQASVSSTASYTSMSASSVAPQPTQKASRSWLPIVLAGVTLLVVLAGVGLLLSSMDDENSGEPSGQPTAQPGESPSTAVAKPNEQTPERATTTSPSGDAKAKPPSSKPAAKPDPSSRPIRPSGDPDSASKTKGSDSSGTDSKSKPAKDESGGSDSIVPQDSVPIDPEQAKREREANAEQQKREEEERAAEPSEAEDDREPGRGNGKAKGHDKKKPE